MIIDGYDLTSWNVQAASREEGAAALRAAGITPEEWNTLWDESRVAYGTIPRDRYLFGWEHDRLVAWKA